MEETILLKPSFLGSPCMDLELAEEQRQLQNAAIEFSRSELNDDVIARDRDEAFSFEGWRKCARFGVLFI